MPYFSLALPSPLDAFVRSPPWSFQLEAKWKGRLGESVHTKGAVLMTDTNVQQDEPYYLTLTEKLRWARDAHYDASRWFSSLDGWMTWGASGLAALASLSVLMDLAKTDTTWKLTVAVLSGAAAVLVAMTKTLKNSDRAADHRRAAANFGGLAEEMEQCGSGVTQGKIDEIQAKKLRLTGSAPELPARFANRHVASRSARPARLLSTEMSEV